MNELLFNSKSEQDRCVTVCRYELDRKYSEYWYWIDGDVRADIYAEAAKLSSVEKFLMFGIRGVDTSRIEKRVFMLNTSDAENYIAGFVQDTLEDMWHRDKEKDEENYRRNLLGWE